MTIWSFATSSSGVGSSSDLTEKPTVLLTGIRSFVGTHLAVELAKHDYHVRGLMASLSQAEVLDAFLRPHILRPHREQEEEEEEGEHESRLTYLAQPTLTDSVEGWKKTIDEESGATWVVVSITAETMAIGHTDIESPAQLAETLVKETSAILQACIQSENVTKVLVLTNSHALPSHHGDLQTQLWATGCMTAMNGVEPTPSKKKKGQQKPVFPRAVAEMIAEKAAWKAAKQIAAASAATGNNKIFMVHTTPSLLGPILTDEIPGATFTSKLHRIVKLFPSIKNVTPEQKQWPFAVMDVRDAVVGIREVLEREVPPKGAKNVTPPDESVWLPFHNTTLQDLLTVAVAALPDLAKRVQNPGMLAKLAALQAPPNPPSVVKALENLQCSRHLAAPLDREAKVYDVVLQHNSTAAVLGTVLSTIVNQPKLTTNTQTIEKAKEVAAAVLNKKRVEAVALRRKATRSMESQKEKACRLASTLPYGAAAASALEHGAQGPNGFAGLFGNQTPPWYYGVTDIPSPRTQFWRFIMESIYSTLAHSWMLDVSGLENIPRAGQPFVVISNHGSHVDPFLIGCNLPGALSGTLVALAKADFNDLEGVSGTVLGTRVARGIPVERFSLKRWTSARQSLVKTIEGFQSELVPDRKRNQKTVENAVKVLKDHGRPMVMFPEGTRTRDGTLLPFHSGAIHIARDAGVPILPVNIRNAFQNWPALRGPKLFGAKPVSLTFGPIVPHSTLADEDFNAEKLREVVKNIVPDHEGEVINVDALRPLGDSGGYDTLYSHDDQHIRVVPRTAQDVVDCVLKAKSEGRIIATRGTGYSFGGQTIPSSYGQKTMQIDMTGLTVCTYDSSKDLVTAQAGAKWIQVNSLLRTLKRRATSSTSYDRFSVGGAVSVNGHGRGGGSIPSTLGDTVVKMTVVTAEGVLKTLERPSAAFVAQGDHLDYHDNEDDSLFRLMIGGWGMFGIIVDATFTTVEDVEVAPCPLQLMEANGFTNWWKTQHHDQVAAFGRLTTAVGERWQRAMGRTWVVSERQEQKLGVPPAGHSRTRAIIERPFLTFAMYAPSFMLEPFLRMKYYAEVAMRLATAKRSLASRALSENFDNLTMWGSKKDVVLEGKATLIEFFVPLSKYSQFVSKGAEVLERYPSVPLLNTTLRIVQESRTAYLSYMPPNSDEPAVAIVLFIRRDDDEQIASLTRELTEKALSVGGNFYLPYLRHPSKDHVRKAYGADRYDTVVEARSHFDPDGLFRSAFSDHYFPTLAIRTAVEEKENLRGVMLFDPLSVSAPLDIHGVKLDGTDIMAFVTQNEREIAEAAARVTTSIPLLGRDRRDSRSGRAFGLVIQSRVTTLVGLIVTVALFGTVFFLSIFFGRIGMFLSVLLVGRAAWSFKCDLAAYEWSWDTKLGALVVKVASLRGRLEEMTLRAARSEKGWDLELAQRFPDTDNPRARAFMKANLSKSLGRVLDKVYYHLAKPELLPEALNYDIEMSEHFAKCSDGVIIRLRRVTRKVPIEQGGPAPSAAIIAPAWDSDTDSLTPFANHLLITKPTVTEVWLLDHRGGAWWFQARPGRAGGPGWDYSQVGLFDWPAAIDLVRKHGTVGDNIHCIGQCMGSVGLMIATAHEKISCAKSITFLSTGLINDVAQTQKRAFPFWDLYERFLPSWGQACGSPGASPLSKVFHSLTKVWHARLSGDPANCILATSLSRTGEEGPFLHRNVPADRQWRVGLAFGGEFGQRVTDMLSAGSNNPGAGGITRLFVSEQARAVNMVTDSDGCHYDSFPVQGAREGDALGKLQRVGSRPPMAFMAGELNPMMGTSLLYAGLSVLMAQEDGAPLECRVLKDVGHFDALWGRTAPTVTFDPVADFIRTSTDTDDTVVKEKATISDDAPVALVVATESCEIGLALQRKLNVTYVVSVSDLTITSDETLTEKLAEVEVVIYAAPIGDLGGGPSFSEEFGDTLDVHNRLDHIHSESPWTKYSGPALREAPLNSQPRIQRAVEAFELIASVTANVDSVKRIILASSVLAVCPSDALSRTRATSENPVFTEYDACSWNKDGGGAGAAVAVEVAAAKARSKLRAGGVSMEVICFGEPWGQARSDSKVIVDPFNRNKSFRFAALAGEGIQDVAWAVTPTHKIVQALVERATDTEPGAFRTVAVSSVVTCADLFAYASYDPTLKHLTKKRKQHSLWFSSKGKKTQFGLKRAAYFATKKVSIEFKNEKAKDLVEKVDGFKVLDLCGHLFQPKLSGRRRMFSKRVKASIMAAKPIDISKIIGTDAEDVPAQASLPVMIEEEDEPDITATFTKATQYVLTEGGGWNLTQGTKLELYGLYKYAVEGSTEGRTAPPRYQVTARAKFNAWAALGYTMTQDEAMHKYLDLVESYAPGWND